MVLTFESARGGNATSKVSRFGDGLADRGTCAAICNVVGFLSSASSVSWASFVTAFRKGLCNRVFQASLLQESASLFEQRYGNIHASRHDDLRGIGPGLTYECVFTEGNASRFDHHFPDPVITTGATITPVPGTSQAS